MYVLSQEDEDNKQEYKFEGYCEKSIKKGRICYTCCTCTLRGNVSRVKRVFLLCDK